MAVVFALFAMLASFGIGCGTQINAIAEVMENNLPFAFPRIAVGVIFGIITAVVIIGGIKSIADAEKFIELGADRLGTSRLVKLAKAMEQQG